MGIMKAKKLKNMWGLAFLVSILGTGFVYGFMHIFYLMPIIFSLLIYSIIDIMIRMSEGLIPMIELDDKVKSK